MSDTGPVADKQVWLAVRVHGAIGFIGEDSERRSARPPAILRADRVKPVQA